MTHVGVSLTFTVRGPTTSSPATNPGPNRNTAFWGAAPCKCFLTWPRVARCAVVVGIVAALAGTLLVALQNVVALV